MRLRLLAVLIAAQSASCSAAGEAVRSAKACTEITAGNTTIIIKQAPSMVLSRVGRWKLGKLGAELGSSDVIERSDERETVKVESEGTQVVVSANLVIVDAESKMDEAGGGCGPGIVHLSNLDIGDEHFLQDTGVTVLRALADTGGW